MNYSARLAPETLLEIFYLVQDVNPILLSADISESKLYFRDLTLEERTGLLLAWISITHVCARWRNMALGDASLWTDIPVVLGEEWLHEFLSRSGDQSISIDWRAWSIGPFPVLVRYSVVEAIVVPNNYRRLRNFEAQLDASQPLFPFLSRSWPVLENLSVELGDPPQHVLMDRNAPCLRHLSYYLEADTAGCSTFPWDAPFLRTLTILDIYFHDGISADRMDVFLDALASIPDLIHLRIGNSTPNVPGSSTTCPSCSPRERALSVKLHTLELRGTWDMMHHLTHHICPPSTCRISFVVQEDEHNSAQHDDDIRSLYAKMALYRQSSPVYEAVKLEFKARDTVIRAFRTSAPLSSPSCNYHLTTGNWYKGVPGIHADIEIHLPAENGNVALAFLDALQGSAPDGIRFFSLEIFNHVDIRLNRAHSALQAVCILQLYVNSERNLIPLLSTRPYADSPVPFPALKVLEIGRYCGLSLRQLLPYHCPGCDPLPSLADVLDARRTAGYPISLIHIHAEERIQMLRRNIQERNKSTSGDDEIIREVERLEVMPGVRILGEVEEAMYDFECI